MSKHKKHQELDRRDVLRLGLAGFGSGVLGLNFLPACAVTDESTENTGQTTQAVFTRTNAFYDAVIQIFYGGGPSQTDTWDPKPGSTVALNLFSPVNLGVNDKYGRPIQLGTPLTKIAAAVQAGTAGLGIVRSLVHANGDHNAAVLASQSFWRTIGPAMLYPSIGSVMAYYFAGLTPINIPAVAIDGECNDNKGNPIPMALNGRTSGMGPLLNRPVVATRYDRRKRMLDVLNSGVTQPDGFVTAYRAAVEDAYKITTAGTAAAAFNLTGKTLLPGTDGGFTQRITLAQELVKAGVPYVALSLNGNDSHTNNKATIENKWGANTDPAVAQLAANLVPTGKRVLILMGGEFGRTPKVGVEPDALGNGRDHWYDGFSWGFVSINQPKFKTGAWGYTGPDGLFTQVSRNAGGLPGQLVDPVEMGDFGAFIYRALGFQVGQAAYHVPLTTGMASPVDPVNNSSALMTYFGLV